MAANKQKTVRSARKPRQARKSQAAIPSTRVSKPVTLELKLGGGKAGDYDRQDEAAFQAPLTAPPWEDRLLKVDGYDSTAFMEGGDELHGPRRGARERKRTQREDVVYGSEIDHLTGSSTAKGKTEVDGNFRMSSSPPAILNLRPNSSPPTILGRFPRLTPTISSDIESILNTLASSPAIHIDLPNMYASDSSVVTPYTAAFLTHLYMASYERQQWHTCDLIADTWIRALQAANQKSRGGKSRCTWRPNPALERKFKEGKFGFKEDGEASKLDVEDPPLASDVARVSAPLLRELYAALPPGTGALLLWSDAVALTGRAGERDFVKRRADWPEEMFYDVMCTSLRMVGRRLTLKIEERYAGAWCRYHTHRRSGEVCYAVLARESGWRRDRRGRDEGEGKRVRFDGAGEGVVDGEESEESEEG